MKKIDLCKFQPKRTFGVELEFDRTLQRNSLKSAIRRVCSDGVLITGYQQNSERDKWYCKKDSSCGYEVASRVLGSFSSIGDTVSDLKLLEDVHTELVRSGAKASDRCGLHVTFSVEDMDSESLKSLLLSWVKMEKVVFDLMPRRRITSQYCHPSSRPFLSNQEYGLEELKGLIRGRGALNLSKLDRYQLIEIRCGEGTEDPRNTKNWVRFVLQLCEVAKMSMLNGANWWDLQEALDYLGLFPQPGKILSPAMSELREWILARTAAYAKFEDWEEVRAEAKSMHEHLYPSPYGVECAI